MRIRTRSREPIFMESSNPESYSGGHLNLVLHNRTITSSGGTRDVLYLSGLRVGHCRSLTRYSSKVVDLYRNDYCGFDLPRKAAGPDSPIGCFFRSRDQHPLL